MSSAVQGRGPLSVPSPTVQPSSRMRWTALAVDRASRSHISAASPGTGSPTTRTLPSISGAWATRSTYSAWAPGEAGSARINPSTPPKTALTVSMIRRPDRKLTESRTRARGSAPTRVRSTAE